MYKPVPNADANTDNTNTSEYELGKVLSRDKDSHTYAATNTANGQQCRVRRIFSAAADRMKADHAHNIVTKLKTVSHDGLLPIVDAYVLNNEDTGSRDLCVVYKELPLSYSLAQKLGENSFEPNLTGGMPALVESEVMDFFFGALAALDNLHSENTAHMDLSPDSVLLCPTSATRPGAVGVVLTNYGLADIIDVNSSEFIPPEVHKREPLLPNMLCKVDIWAFGALLLYAACGKLIVSRLKDSWPTDLAQLLAAYDSRNQSAGECKWNLENILAEHFKEHSAAEGLWARLPTELTTLIRVCLTVNPDNRPTVAELLVTTEYAALLAARNASTSTIDQREQMSCDERADLLRQIADLTEKSVIREERMVFLETVLAEERAGHFRTADLLQEESEKLKEALERIAVLEAQEGVKEEEEEVAVPEVIGLHHPGFYNGELNEWNCCTKKGRIPPGCQDGVTMHHPGYYDPYGGGRWGCCKGGWNSKGCTPGEQPLWER